MLEAMDIARDTYAATLCRESVILAWGKVGGICANRALPPDESRLFYIRGILRNRMAYMSEWKAMSILRDALKAGVSVEDMEHAA